MPGLAQTTLQLDHVIVCVPDLDRSVETFERMSRLVSVPGGRSDVQIVGVTLSGSTELLGSWLGDPVAGIDVEEGPPGVRQVGIRTSSGGVLNFSGDVI